MNMTVSRLRDSQMGEKIKDVSKYIKKYGMHLKQKRNLYY